MYGIGSMLLCTCNHFDFWQRFVWRHSFLFEKHVIASRKMLVTTKTKRQPSTSSSTHVRNNVRVHIWEDGKIICLTRLLQLVTILSDSDQCYRNQSPGSWSHAKDGWRMRLIEKEIEMRLKCCSMVHNCSIVLNSTWEMYWNETRKQLFQLCIS
jgi:hypothetical protein